MALCERVGREASPSAAVLDSQSVKLAEKGDGKDDQVGYMDFENPAETLARSLPSPPSSWRLGGSLGHRATNSTDRCFATNDGQSRQTDCEGTFARTNGNDEDAP
jgi:hypothetical protein